METNVINRTDRYKTRYTRITYSDDISISSDLKNILCFIITPTY